MFVQWRNVKLVFLRELRDQLRDRRTLFMVFILPLLLYPTLGIGMLQLTLLFSEKQRTVVLLGEEFLPPPPLLDGDHFARTLFNDPHHASKLRVITATSLHAMKSEGGKPDPKIARWQELLRRGDILAEKIKQRNMMRAAVAEADREKRVADSVRLRSELADYQNKLAEQFAVSEIQTLVVIPRDFKQHVERVNSELGRRGLQTEIADYARPIVIHNKADEESMAAYMGVSDALKSWEEKILQQRLELAGLPKSLPKPVNPVREDLASEAQIGAVMWSKLFPALLVIMSMTGAFYPAIDLCAGEKERGTMETLLICPAKRIEIVFGKFLTVLCFSVSTAVLNLISIGMTGQHMASLMQRAPGVHMAGPPEFPPWYALCWIIILLLPLAAMFSALCLALATFARSSKEGQYYLTPLLMVTLGLTVFCVSPGIELNLFYSVMPIAGVALLLKGLLLTPQDMTIYLYAIPVLVTSIAYSLLALWWSVDQFQREEVLFREAERFELKLWLRHLMRDKEPTPTFAHAMFCFVLIMMLQFASFKYLSRAAMNASGTLDTAQTMKVMLVQQLALIASPALMMGIMLTTSVWQTFRFRLPSLKMLGLATILAISAHPLSLMLAASLQWFFPPLPDGIAQLTNGMGDPRQPLWMILLPFAIAPAFCEEVAFRGFMLSGLARHGRTWLAIVISSLSFGIMHMIPQQVFNAALLGIVLGIVATRSNSLWPCVIFHFCFNALAVMHGRIGREFGNTLPPSHFYAANEHGQILYLWPTLLISAAVFSVCLWLITRHAEPADSATSLTGVPEIYMGQAPLTSS
ncbi:MAG: Abortive infection protein [Planctomycetaceae bacterium]|nr:Abortive infection protein [Planctomycetaceae bacterium]